MHNLINLTDFFVLDEVFPAEQFISLQNVIRDARGGKKISIHTGI